MSERAARHLTRRYDEHAAVYDELWAPILRRGGRQLLKALDGPGASGSPHPADIVEIGTGVGSLLGDIRAAFPGARITGIDRSQGMLARGPREFPRARMDARALALATDSADLVLQIFMLFHVGLPVDGLRETRRVLRPGGRAATATWGIDNLSKAEKTWVELLDRHHAPDPDPEFKTFHDLVDTKDKVKDLFHEAGFEHARVWTDTLTYRLTPESLIELKTSMGRQKLRFDLLDANGQEACVSDAWQALQTLSPDDFETRSEVVCAIAG